MADTRLADLPAGSQPDGSELIYAVQGGNDVRLSLSQLDFGTTPNAAVNVKAFGAKGDGKTNDTGAIYAAYLAAGAGGSCVIELPVGTYVCDPLVFAAFNDITFQGAQPMGEAGGGTRILSSASVGDTWTFQGVSNVHVNDIGFIYLPVMFVGVIAGNLLTVSVVTQGALAVGQTIRGAGVTAVTIGSQVTGLPGGPGIYTTIGASQTVAVATAMKVTARSAGSFLTFNGCNTSGTSNVFMLGGYTGITTIGVVGLMRFAGRLDIRNFNGFGLKLGGYDHVFEYLVMDMDADEYFPLAGLYAEQNQGNITIHYANILHTHVGIWLNPGAGQNVSWIIMSKVVIDTPDFVTRLAGGIGFLVSPHSGGKVLGGMVSDLWIGTCPIGMQLVGDSTSTLTSMIFTNVKILNCFDQGAKFDYCDHIEIVNPAIVGNSFTTPGTENAVEVGPGVSSLSFTGGYIGGNAENYGITHKANINIDPAFIGLLTMSNVDMRGYAVAAVLPAPQAFADTGAVGSYISGCAGYNPGGAYAQTVGPSPFVHQTGYTNERLVFAGGTVSSIAVKNHAGDTSVTVATGSNTTIMPPPRSTVTVTYTAAPTLNVIFG